MNIVHNLRIIFLEIIHRMKEIESFLDKKCFGVCEINM